MTNDLTILEIVQNAFGDKYSSKTIKRITECLRTMNITSIRELCENNRINAIKNIKDRIMCQLIDNFRKYPSELDRLRGLDGMALIKHTKIIMDYFRKDLEMSNKLKIDIDKKYEHLDLTELETVIKDPTDINKPNKLRFSKQDLLEYTYIRGVMNIPNKSKNLYAEQINSMAKLLIQKRV